MKVILYMAVTANGMIATEDEETPWSTEEWDAYRTMVKKSGNIVIGKKTYEVMKEISEFDKIGNPLIVVVSSEEKPREEGSFLFVNSPQNAISVLNKKGFHTILLAGGGKINSSFIKLNLVDELYLDIEPFLFGNGIPLFYSDNFEVKLKLLESKLLNKNTLQLHYKVLK